MRHILIATIAAAASLTAGCSSVGGDGSTADAAASTGPVTVTATDGTSYTGTAQDIAYLEDMQLNGYWPDTPADDLIDLAHAVCAAYDEGGDSDGIQAVMQLYGVPGEDAVYLDVLMTANYCPEH